jgi:RNA polymerase sigma factor (sigma-70 family)
LVTVERAEIRTLLKATGRGKRWERFFDKMDTPQKDWTVSELIKRCCARPPDESAWNEFVCRFQPTIRTTVARVYKTKAREDTDRREQFPDDLVEDLTQAVYCRLIENQSQALIRFENAHLNSIYRYLMMISVNVVRDYFREAKALKRPRISISLDEAQSVDAPGVVHRSLPGSAAGYPASRPGATVSMEDIESALERAVGWRNRDRDILIFKLHYVEGMTLDEIAMVVGKKISKVGINSILTRITRRVRELLGGPTLSR